MPALPDPTLLPVWEKGLDLEHREALLESAAVYEVLAAQAPDAEAYLIPCRASGLHMAAPTYFLDERPERHNWTMIACERSRQMHQHFYGDEAPRIEMCPRRLTQEDGRPTLLKCCLLEDYIEVEGNWAVVPWGANLAQVEAGLKALADMVTDDLAGD